MKMMKMLMSHLKCVVRGGVNFLSAGCGHANVSKGGFQATNVIFFSFFIDFVFE